MNKNFLLILGFVATSYYSIATSEISAEANVDIEKLITCRDIKVSLTRLSCFDSIVNTPNYNKNSATAEINPQIISTKSRTEIISDELEANREKGDYAWRTTQFPEPGMIDQNTVIMSKPAIGKIGKQHRLILSCIDNITRLQILLPKESTSLRAEISLVDMNQKELVGGTWRIVANKLVGPGLGLESISIISRLFNHNLVKTISENPELDSLIFDLTDLREISKPLQTECHWSR